MINLVYQLLTAGNLCAPGCVQMVWGATIPLSIPSVRAVYACERNFSASKTGTLCTGTRTCIVLDFADDEPDSDGSSTCLDVSDGAQPLNKPLRLLRELLVAVVTAGCLTYFMDWHHCLRAGSQGRSSLRLAASHLC